MEQKSCFQRSLQALRNDAVLKSCKSWNWPQAEAFLGRYTEIPWWCQFFPLWRALNFCSYLHNTSHQRLLFTDSRSRHPFSTHLPHPRESEVSKKNAASLGITCITLWKVILMVPILLVQAYCSHKRFSLQSSESPSWPPDPCNTPPHTHTRHSSLQPV